MSIEGSRSKRQRSDHRRTVVSPTTTARVASSRSISSPATSRRTVDHLPATRHRHEDDGALLDLQSGQQMVTMRGDLAAHLLTHLSLHGRTEQGIRLIETLGAAGFAHLLEGLPGDGAEGEVVELRIDGADGGEIDPDSLAAGWSWKSLSTVSSICWSRRSSSPRSAAICPISADMDPPNGIRWSAARTVLLWLRRVKRSDSLS